MVDYEAETPGDAPPASSFKEFLARDWPYIAMLVLALLGVALTSVARQAMMAYWIALAPLYGLICVAYRWQEAADESKRWVMVRTQTLHWGSVILAMSLVFVAGVRALMNTDVSALVLLILLALGTVTAGVHTASWRMCLVGFLLGLCVPAVAWLDISTLLALMIAVVMLVIAGMFFKHEPPTQISE
jgi:hypothetical protein